MLGQTPMAQLLGYGIGDVNTLGQIFLSEIATVIWSIYARFVSDIPGVTID
jgi:hypothetical protein